METKNTLIITWIVAIAVGIFIGWLIWGNRMMRPGTHMMSGGMMMQNKSMMGSDMDMDDMMQGMTESLSGKTGNAFDREFLSQMIIHHEGAVAMAQMVLKTSKRPELIKLANDIIAAQTGEITMMQNWEKTWFGQ